MEYTSTISINDLPNEIIDIILSLIEFEDRKNLALSCKKWNEITFSSLYLRNKITLHINELSGSNITRAYINLNVTSLKKESSFVNLKTVLQNCRGSVKNLDITIENDEYDLFDLLNKVDLEKLSIRIKSGGTAFDTEKYEKETQALPKLKKLKSLSIYHDMKVQDPSTTYLVNKVPEMAENVEELNLTRIVENLYHDHKLRQLLGVIDKLCPKLKKLTTFAESYSEITSLKFPVLEELNLSLYEARKFLTEEEHQLVTLFRHLGQCTKLKKIKIYVLVPYTINDTTLFNYLPPSVQELSIQLNFFKNVTECNSVPYLKKLILERHHYSYLKKEYLIGFFKFTSFPSLTELTINDCIFDQKVIAIISKSAHKLEKLIIYGGSVDEGKIEDFDFKLQSMREMYFPNLSTLSFYSGGKYLTDMDDEDLEPMFLDEEFMEGVDIQQADIFMEHLERFNAEVNN